MGSPVWHYFSYKLVLHVEKIFTCLCFSVWHYLLSISVHHHNLIHWHQESHSRVPICLSEIHLTSHDQCLENSSPRRWMSSTPPAAHACTLKRQRESNLNIQLRALTIKDMMCTYIETWRTKGSPLAGCFGSTSESAGGFHFPANKI